jgi:hypothetical protein
VRSRKVRKKHSVLRAATHARGVSCGLRSPCILLIGTQHWKSTIPPLERGTTEVLFNGKS